VQPSRSRQQTQQLPLTAQGSRGGARPAEVGARLEYEVRRALGALPGVVVHRNPQIRATTPTGAAVLTGIGGKGAPDIVVEVRTASGVTACLWLECKAGTGELNPDQKVWHAAAAREGRHVVIVRQVADATEAVAKLRAGASR